MPDVVCLGKMGDLQPRRDAADAGRVDLHDADRALLDVLGRATIVSTLLLDAVQ
jgi:hypothetical protein